MMLVIYGPTTTGKTGLAINLAKKYNGELISMDSRQVYKKLDIGTGKVSFDSKCKKYNKYWVVDGVKINGFDLVNPEENFTVANFMNFVNITTQEIKNKNKIPIIVGGTGFYLNALLKGIDSIGIAKDEQLRLRLEKITRKELYNKLVILNKKKAQSMNKSDRLNPRRLIRAIEIELSKNKQKSNQQKLLDKNFILIGLNAPNTFLYKKVDRWVDERVEKGMINETRKLIEDGINLEWLENLGLEYRWISRLVLGKLSKKEALSRLKGDIHSYVRRQKTWIKKFEGIKIYDTSKKGWQNKVENDINTLTSKPDL